MTKRKPIAESELTRARPYDAFLNGFFDSLSLYWQFCRASAGQLENDLRLTVNYLKFREKIDIRGKQVPAQMSGADNGKFMQRTTLSNKTSTDLFDEIQGKILHCNRFDT